MGKWMRPAAAIGLAAVIAAGGCGRGGGGGDDGQSAAIDDKPAKGTINVWAMGAEGEKLKQLTKDFTKDNPDATVKVTPIPWDGAHDKIANAIAAGETPDVSLIGTTWMGEFAKTDGLDPTPSNMASADEYYEGAWDTTMVDEVSYGIPWYVETRLFYVNKSAAGKAGVTEPPADWDAFKSAVEDLQSDGGVDSGISLLPGGIGSWQTVLPFVWQNGGEVVDGDEFTFDSPEVIEALDYYKSFFDDGLASKAKLGNEELEPKFVKGEIGAFPSGPWHIGMLKDLDAADDYELWPMPTKESATSFVGGGDLAVFKDSKNRDGAWKYVDYLSQPDVQVKWFKTIGDLPAVKSAWDDPVLDGDPRLSAFGAQLEQAESPPTIPTWEQVAAKFDAEIEEMVKTGKSPKATAEAIQKQATSIGIGA